LQIRRELVAKAALQRDAVMKVVEKARLTKNWNAAQHELADLLDSASAKLQRVAAGSRSRRSGSRASFERDAGGSGGGGSREHSVSGRSYERTSAEAGATVGPRSGAAAVPAPSAQQHLPQHAAWARDGEKAGKAVHVAAASGQEYTLKADTLAYMLRDAGGRGDGVGGNAGGRGDAVGGNAGGHSRIPSAAVNAAGSGGLHRYGRAVEDTVTRMRSPYEDVPDLSRLGLDAGGKVRQ
jgi:hypothetical protein